MQIKRTDREARSLTDYKVYHFSPRERIIELGKGAVLLAVTSMLFYGSLKMIVILSPYLYFYMKMQKNKYNIKRKQKLQNEFKEGMLLLVTALHAGYSIENSLAYAKNELERMSGERKNLFAEEIGQMLKKIELKVSVEELFLDLAVRSELSEIHLFATVLVISRQNGGNLIKIIHKTVEHLSRKVQVENEISVLITGKKFEKNIMCVMPYFVILYMNLTNRSYMSALYGNLIGGVLMSLCLILVLLANYWADRLIKIGV